jgi:hypothetical protein
MHGKVVGEEQDWASSQDFLIHGSWSMQAYPVAWGLMG